MRMRIRLSMLLLSVIVLGCSALSGCKNKLDLYPPEGIYKIDVLDENDITCTEETTFTVFYSPLDPQDMESDGRLLFCTTSFRDGNNNPLCIYFRFDRLKDEENLLTYQELGLPGGCLWLTPPVGKVDYYAFSFPHKDGTSHPLTLYTADWSQGCICLDNRTSFRYLGPNES